MSSDKYFNGETADDCVNRFDDVNNNLAFEATEKVTKDISKVSLVAKDTSSVELSETVSVFVTKIASKNLTNGDSKIDSDISITMR